MTPYPKNAIQTIIHNTKHTKHTVTHFQTTTKTKRKRDRTISTFSKNKLLYIKFPKLIFCMFCIFDVFCIFARPLGSRTVTER